MESITGSLRIHVLKKLAKQKLGNKMHASCEVCKTQFKKYKMYQCPICHQFMFCEPCKDKVFSFKCRFLKIKKSS